VVAVVVIAEIWTVRRTGSVFLEVDIARVFFLLIATIAVCRSGWDRRLGLVAYVLIAACVVVKLAGPAGEEQTPAGIRAMIAELLIICVVAIRVIASELKRRHGGQPWQTFGPRALRRVYVITAIGTTAYTAYWCCKYLYAGRFEMVTYYHLWHEPCLSVAADGTDEPIIVAPGLSMIQAWTRRPLLLSPGELDFIPYVPGAAPAIARILDEVYGIDYFDPPFQHRGALAPEPTRSIWEARTPEEWMHIRATHSATQVLVSPDYTLDLPELARSAEYILYAIPEP
jgi:hypothetical protein